MKISLEKLNISEIEVRYSFYKQENQSKKVAVFFPGAGYSCMGPCLYYPSNLMLNKGFDVINLEYDFRLIEKPSDYHSFLSSIGKQILTALSFTQSYDELMVFGKSIGTRIISSTLKTQEFNSLKNLTKIAYLTPCWNDETLFETMLESGVESIHIIGTADPLYNKDCHTKLQEKGIEVLSIQGADHGLDIEGDINNSLNGIQKIIQVLDHFVERQK